MLFQQDAIEFELIFETNSALRDIAKLLERLGRAADKRPPLEEIGGLLKMIRNNVQLLNLETAVELTRTARELVDSLLRSETRDDVATIGLLRDALVGLGAVMENHGREAGGGEAPKTSTTAPPVNVAKIIERARRYLGANGDNIAGGDRIGDILIQSGSITAEDVNRAMRIQDGQLGQILVDTGALKAEELQTALGKQAHTNAAAAAAFVRVDVQSIHRIVDRLKALATQTGGVLGLKLVAVCRQLLLLERVPLEPTLKRLEYFVLTTAEELGKQIRFEAHDMPPAMGKTLLEELTDILINLARYTLECCVETSDDRHAAGKSRTCRVTLAIEEVDRGLRLVFSNDGHGFDRDVLIARLRKRGAGAGAELDLEAAPLIDLLCLAATPARSVNGAEGRRDLEAVRAGVDRLGGDIQIDTTPHLGASFILRIPRS